MTDLSLYLHIPFCVRKCAYCDFLSAPADEAARAAYADALCREIRACAQEDRSAAEPEGPLRVVSIFLGGGTPSLLTAAQIGRILDTAREAYPVAPDAEITMEANPGTVTEASLTGYRACGVDRLSLGVQSFSEKELKVLGRIHTPREACEAYEAARRAGFGNINLDLISGLPGQRLPDWIRTLERAASLGPEHISAYSLILEEGTPLLGAVVREEAAGEDGRTGVRVGTDVLWLPEEDEERAMYHETARVLALSGYARYEISNYARSGFESVHNNGYWTGRLYRGCGLGAASLLKRDGKYIRTSGTRSLTEYLDVWSGTAEDAGGPIERPEHAGGPAERPGRYAGQTVLSERDRQEEFFFLGLRRMEGVSRSAFERLFGPDAWSAFAAQIGRHVRLGTLQSDGDRLRLTERGIDVSNTVFSDLMR